MKAHHYRLIWLRLIVCLLASIDININGHWYLIPKAVVSPMFYLAFVVSFAICYLLLYFIHRINHFLDESSPWTASVLTRAKRQAFFAIILPAFIDLTLIVGFYVITGRADRLIDHFYYEYPRVFLFIVAVNIFYVVIKFVRLAKEASHSFVIKHNGVDIKLNVLTDVLFVYKDGRKTRVCTISGNSYSSTDTISKLKAAYQNEGLCQVNPSALINLRMLKGHEPGSKLKTLTPLFKPQFQDKISSSNLEKLIVTRNYMSDFKKEMEKYRTPHVQIEDVSRQSP